MPVFTWIKFIPYGVAVLCVIGALVCYIGWDTAAANADAAELRASAALEQNKADAATIKAISAARAIDDRLVADLTTKIETIRTGQDATTAKLAELERANKDVADFLSLDLPDELKRVLNSPDPLNDNGRNGTAAGNNGQTLPKTDKQR